VNQSSEIPSGAPDAVSILSPPAGSDLARHSNAVIVRAGARSLHPGWLEGEPPEFDLYVLAYAPPPASPATTYVEEVHLPGQKVAGWHAFLTARPDIFERYERIALIDNDIACSAREINLAFRRGREHALWLWQPSLTPDSYFTYGICLQNPFFAIRFVNFVEMMCPFFSSAYLKECSALFGLGYETAIDLLWCRLRADSAYRFAILDEVSVKHTEPVGALAHLQGFTGKISNYRDVIKDVLARFNITFRGPVAYAGDLRLRRRVKGRAAMTLLSMAILFHYRAAPRPKSFRKSVTDHIRHNLTRPIDADDITTRRVLSTLPSGRASHILDV
jgi:hypothetical protein